MADPVTGTTGRPSIQPRNIPSLFARRVRRDFPLATAGHKFLLVIRFVRAESSNSGGVQFPMFIHLCQRHSRLVLGNGIMHRDGRTQSVSVLHQHLRPKTQLAGLAIGFPIQHAFRIGRAAVRRIAPRLPVKIDRRIAGVIVFGRGHFGLVLPILAHKTLQAGPRFDQRAVGRKVLVAGPAFGPRQIIDLRKKQLRGIRREHPVIIMGEHRRVETPLIQFPVQKPKPQEIVGQLLAEQPLTAHRIERHQYPTLEQLLRRNRRPSFAGIQLVKQRRKLPQHLVHARLDPAQRMVGGHPLVQIDRRQKFRLGLRFSTHPSLTFLPRQYSNFLPVFQQPANVSTIGGGFLNTVQATSSTIAGGYNNTIQSTSSGSSIGGGEANVIQNIYGTIPGGYGNAVTGPYSFAAGKNATASGFGSFVWSDGNAATTSTGDHQFVVRCTGGAIFYTANGTSTGVQLASGGGSWSSLSDRNVKEDFAPVDAKQVLEKVAKMPVTTWNYIAQGKTIRHIGPMAQDFYAGFNVGEDERHITTIDEGGVALAAIQGLNMKLQEKDAEIQALKERLEKLERALSSSAGNH